MAVTGTAYPYDHAKELDRAHRLARLQKLARMMDSAVSIPGTGIRLGMDPILGLAPVVGDVLAQGIAAFIIYEAHQLGLPKRKLARMGGNMLMDMTFGSIPLAGDIFDMFWRSNDRNMRIILDHFAEAERR